MQAVILPPGAFRLLLAFAVVVSHLSNLDIGRVAVLLFFFLSGYWVTDIWQGKFAASDRWRFYASRFLRIWPLFLIVTIAAALVKGKDLGLTNFTLLGLAASGEVNDPTNVSWSLDIELQFYLLAPFLIAALVKAPRLTLAASVALLPLGWWLDYAFAGLTVLKFLPAFLVGALVRLYRWTPSAQTATLSLAAFAGATFAVAFTSAMWKSQPDLVDRDMFGLLWTLPLVPYIVRSLNVKAGAFDRMLGELSFPLYLVHPLVKFVVLSAGADTLGAKVLIVLLSLLAAYGVFRLIDRPLDSVRRTWTDRPARAARPASASAASLG